MTYSALLISLHMQMLPTAPYVLKQHKQLQRNHDIWRYNVKNSKYKITEPSKKCAASHFLSPPH